MYRLTNCIALLEQHSYFGKPCRIYLGVNEKVICFLRTLPLLLFNYNFPSCFHPTFHPAFTQLSVLLSPNFPSCFHPTYRHAFTQLTVMLSPFWLYSILSFYCFQILTQASQKSRGSVHFSGFVSGMERKKLIISCSCCSQFVLIDCLRWQAEQRV